MVKLRIKEILDERDISVYSLIQPTGLTYLTLLRVVNGKSDPKLSTIQKISSALGLKVGDLIDETTEEDLVPQVSERSFGEG